MQCPHCPAARPCHAAFLRGQHALGADPAWLCRTPGVEKAISALGSSMGRGVARPGVSPFHLVES